MLLALNLQRHCEFEVCRALHLNRARYVQRLAAEHRWDMSGLRLAVPFGSLREWLSVRAARSSALTRSSCRRGVSSSPNRATWIAPSVCCTVRSRSTRRSQPCSDGNFSAIGDAAPSNAWHHACLCWKLYNSLAPVV
eukprot:3731196-Prymnesium_polylepis.1